MTEQLRVERWKFEEAELHKLIGLVDTNTVQQSGTPLAVKKKLGR